MSTIWDISARAHCRVTRRTKREKVGKWHLLPSWKEKKLALSLREKEREQQWRGRNSSMRDDPVTEKKRKKKKKKPYSLLLPFLLKRAFAPLPVYRFWETVAGRRRRISWKKMWGDAVRFLRKLILFHFSPLRRHSSFRSMVVVPRRGNSTIALFPSDKHASAKHNWL